MSAITKEQLIEDLKASTQNFSGMFEIGEETICALMSLLTAPPAPVAVPNEMTMQKALSAINRLSWQECTRDAYMHGWNACRAAMLNQEKSNG